MFFFSAVNHSLRSRKGHLKSSDLAVDGNHRPRSHTDGRVHRQGRAHCRPLNRPEIIIINRGNIEGHRLYGIRASKQKANNSHRSRVRLARQFEGMVSFWKERDGIGGIYFERFNLPKNIENVKEKNISS
jgi:hypothetical protein